VLGGPRLVRGPIPVDPHARQGVPCSGGGSARARADRPRGVGEVLVELVVDRGLALRGGRGLGVLLLAVRALGLLVRGVGAFDRLLELGQRRGYVRPGELAQRLGGHVLVRAPAGARDPLAGGDHEPRRVLLGRDHDEGAAVELAGGLGAVDELSGAPDNSSYAEPRVMPSRGVAVRVLPAQPRDGALIGSA